MSEGVVAVENPSANNPVLAKMLKSAVPHPLRRFVLTEKDIIDKWPKLIESKRKYCLIIRSSEILVKIFKNGIKFMTQLNLLNVGPMSVSDNIKKFGKNLSMATDEEKGDLDGLFFGISNIYPGKVGKEFHMTKDHKHKKMIKVNINEI